MTRSIRPAPAPLAAIARPAFATITAVTLIALVAVAMAAIVAAAAADARRTRQAALGAQLRQLLLAGAADAASRSAGWADAPPSQPWELALPDELTQEGTHVTLDPGPPPEAVNVGAAGAAIRVEAVTPAARSAETLRFTKTPAGWRLAESTLEGTEMRR